MTERFLAPIMIGITGKRDLQGKDHDVEAALRACFDLIDRELSASKKLFLTGLAAGADTIAARLASDRGWKVVAVLPFALDLYAQDFDEAGAEQLLAFADPKQGRLADPARGEILVLDPLINPQTKGFFKPEELSRSAGKPNPERSDHYEQVGLFIAERCALLIGVMRAGEQPDRIGGTARIIDYRLRGQPDPASERIIRNSSVLRRPVVLDSPQTGPIWLVDLDELGHSPANPLRATECWYAKSGTLEFEIQKVAGRRDHDLVHPLRLAVRLNAFNRLALRIGEDTWRKEVAARARRDAQWQSEIEAHKRPARSNATSALSEIRLVLSVLQGSKKQALTFTVKLLAGLFVLAVFAVELHLEFEGLDPLIAYIAFLVLIPCVFVVARELALQQYSEDYRAVAEAARVQLAWWDAGISKAECRVDQMYLTGTHGSLALVRAVIRHLIDAALLEYAPPTRSPPDVERWINGQVSYFQSRTAQRRSSLSKFEDVIWFLFLSSLGMAATMLPLMMSITGENMVIRDIDVLRGWTAPVLALLIVCALFVLGRRITHIAKTWHVLARRLPLEVLNAVLAFGAGALIAFSIYGFVSPPYDLSGRLIDWGVTECRVAAEVCAHQLAHKLVATVTIVIASIAGALRFYVERLAFDAELHSYREALGTFRRAQAEWTRLADDMTEGACAQRDRILLELGRYALRENESWIRAHRVRPLEPHL